MSGYTDWAIPAQDIVLLKLIMFVISSNLRNLLNEFAQILEILNSTFKTTLVQKFSRIKVHNYTIIWPQKE
jgi:hypothetical protein